MPLPLKGSLAALRIEIKKLNFLDKGLK